MKRAVFVLAIASTLSCKFAVKHPAVTAGTVAGTLGFGMCELASSEHAKCLGISAGGGVTIALLAAFALWLGYEDADPAGGGAPGTDPITVDPTNLTPAPVFLPKGLDAGAGDSPPADAAIDAAAPIDAP
jgi:predicted metal-binding membrane protein